MHFSNREPVNSDLLPIVNGKRLRKLAREIALLRAVEVDNHLPANLLVAIFLIETKERPAYMRYGEYILVVFGAFQNTLMRKPVKNYTIGKCQLGLATILNYFGTSLYQHLEHIERFDAKDLGIVIKSVSSKIHFLILAHRVTPIYQRATRIYESDVENVCCYVGEQYNGRYTYGILLSEVVKTLGKK